MFLNWVSRGSLLLLTSSNSNHHWHCWHRDIIINIISIVIDWDQPDTALLSWDAKLTLRLCSLSGQTWCCASASCSAWQQPVLLPTSSQRRESPTLDTLPVFNYWWTEGNNRVCSCCRQMWTRLILTQHWPITFCTVSDKPEGISIGLLLLEMIDKCWHQ